MSGKIVFPGPERALVRFIVFLLGMLLLAGCTTNVKVVGTIPTPLVSKIPARIGVYYPQEFREFRYREVIKEAGTWDIDLGSQNLSFFRNLMNALFISTAEVSEPPVQASEMTNLDGIIVLRIEKFGFLTPSISGLKFYSASIEYRVELYDAENERIGEWNIIGYGKSEGGGFGSNEALNEATMLAIRDGGARIAIDLIDKPRVQKWLVTLQNEAK